MDAKELSCCQCRYFIQTQQAESDSLRELLTETGAALSSRQLVHLFFTTVEDKMQNQVIELVPRGRYLE